MDSSRSGGDAEPERRAAFYKAVKFWLALLLALLAAAAVWRVLRSAHDADEVDPVPGAVSYIR